jgi:hypothetical protein
MTANVCMPQWSFPNMAKNVKAWRIFLTNTGTIMASAMDARLQTIVQTLRRVAGIDGQHRARDVAAAVTQEIFDHARDVLRVG